jgi:hypothetical protein
VAAALLAAGATGGAARGDYFGPSHYLGFGDRPAAFQGPGFAYYHLEDFEDGSLNTPGASADAGWAVLGPGAFTDSVDGDDGAIDGRGTAGGSFYSGNVGAALTITFDASALGGRLPTHVGIVWTDVGDAGGSVGVGDVSFTARGPGGVLPGGPAGVVLGDGDAAGATAEDRFFGVIDPAGIASITIRTGNSVDWEVDHLQYGFRPVPEPGGLALTALGVLAVLAGSIRARGRCAA